MPKVQQKVPTCPNCGAKFSHSQALLECLKCGIPDEIAQGGPQLIARWRKKTARVEQTKSQVRKHRHPGTRSKKRHKHGRPV